MVIVAVLVGIVGGIQLINYPFAVDKLFDLGSSELLEAECLNRYVVFTARKCELYGLAVITADLGQIGAFKYCVGVGCDLKRIEKSVSSDLANLLVLNLVVGSVKKL